MANPARRVLAIVTAAALAGWWWWLEGADERPAEPPGARTLEDATLPTTGDEERDRSAVVFPRGFQPEHPPGTRTAARPPAVTNGIPIGGGRFLPPLNGVRIEDGIPPIRRNPRLPPPGPVVAKRVDRSGQEWWEHADGSQTSCSYANITTADGTEKVIVSTQHGAPIAGRGELGADRPRGQ